MIVGVRNESGGRGIFTQIQLHKSPSGFSTSPETIQLLSNADDRRIVMVRQLLHRLGLRGDDQQAVDQRPALSTCQLVGIDNQVLVSRPSKYETMNTVKQELLSSANFFIFGHFCIKCY